VCSLFKQSSWQRDDYVHKMCKCGYVLHGQDNILNWQEEVAYFSYCKLASEMLSSYSVIPNSIAAFCVVIVILPYARIVSVCNVHTIAQ
jgi:hypothetical protein